MEMTIILMIEETIMKLVMIQSIIIVYTKVIMMKVYSEFIIKN